MKMKKLRISLFIISFTALAAISAAGGMNKRNPVASLNDAGGTFERVSSTQVKGNGDFISIPAGKSAVIFDVKGRGIIRKIWVTVLCADPTWPRMITIEMFWDGSDEPSVKAPLGDFFGAVMGARREFESEMLNVLPLRGAGFNAHWPMPFEKGAKIVVKNESTLPVQAFYYQVDYIVPENAEISKMRFAASYAQVEPVVYEEKMRDFEIMQAEGEGCLAGYVIGIHNSAGGWFGEGDEIIEIDGRRTQGTGLEDAVGSAWRPNRSYSTPRYGFLFDGRVVDNWKGTHMLYRFYTDMPVCHEESISVKFERRPQDAWSSVVYRYTRGAVEAAEIPKAADRLPPIGQEGEDALLEIRRLFMKVYKISGWPGKQTSFDALGDMINRVDVLFAAREYSAAIRLLKAAARE